MRYKHQGRGALGAALFVLLAACCWVVGGVGEAEEVARPSGDAMRGRELFKNYGCFACHGTEGQGASTGPKLAPGPLPLEAFLILVRNPANIMPPYSEKVLSEGELRDIHAFLASVTAPSPEELREIGRRGQR